MSCHFSAKRGESLWSVAVLKWRGVARSTVNLFWGGINENGNSMFGSMAIIITHNLKPAR